MEELAHRGFLSRFLIHPGPPAQGWSHAQCSGPSPTNEENVPTGQSYRGIFLSFLVKTDFSMYSDRLNTVYTYTVFVYILIVVPHPQLLLTPSLPPLEDKWALHPGAGGRSQPQAGLAGATTMSRYMVKKWKKRSQGVCAPRREVEIERQ